MPSKHSYVVQPECLTLIGYRCPLSESLLSPRSPRKSCRLSTEALTLYR